MFLAEDRRLGERDWILVQLMLCQLSYKVKSVWVCGISELSLVPSIPMGSDAWSFMIFLYAFWYMLWTQVNIMFLMLLWVYIHTGQAEKLAWPWWESMLSQLSYKVKLVRMCVISELILLPSIPMRFDVCVRFDVIYSGEYNGFDVTLSVYPHRAGWKVSQTMVGIEPATIWNHSSMLCQLSYAVQTTVVRLTFQPAWE